VKHSPSNPLLSALAVIAGAVLTACSPQPQSLGTAPSTPTSSITDIANTGASDPDPGVSTKPVKIDTGIDPYADRKQRR